MYCVMRASVPSRLPTWSLSCDANVPEVYTYTCTTRLNYVLKLESSLQKHASRLALLFNPVSAAFMQQCLTHCDVAASPVVFIFSCRQQLGNKRCPMLG